MFLTGVFINKPILNVMLFSRQGDKKNPSSHAAYILVEVE